MKDNQRALIPLLFTVVSWASWLIVLVICSSHSFGFPAKTKEMTSASRQNELKIFLQSYLQEPTLEVDETSRYSAAFVDLNGDGIDEAIVYLSGDTYCGSGGCITLVLSRHESSFRVVTRVTITKLPIRVLTSKSNGWSDITVVVSGGGIQPGYESQLCFDGTSYPDNPSGPPARPLSRKVVGKVVVPASTKGLALYP
jgi:hypothetical protein